MRAKNKQIDYVALVDELKRISIVQIFDRYMNGKLRYHGSKAVTVCPWHGRDSSPSLTLYVNRGNWYCYGCQRGGTNIDMVMQALGVDFKTAVATIARDFGFDNSRPDPSIRQHVIKQQERRSVDLAFDADFERVCRILLQLRNIISVKLRTYEDFEKNLGLVHTLPTMEGVIDELLSAREQADKLRAWRLARKVFPWLQKMKI